MKRIFIISFLIVLYIFLFKDNAYAQSPCASGYSCMDYTSQECLSSGSSPGECESRFGTFNCCAPQNYCDSGYSCLNVTEQTCTDNGGSYVACYTGTESGTCCTPQQACSNPNGCTSLSRDYCQSSGGTYIACYTGSGPGTCCLPDLTDTCTLPEVCMDVSPFDCTQVYYGTLGSCITPRNTQGNCCAIPLGVTGNRCTGALSGDSGFCGFLFCNPNAYATDGWNPQSPTCHSNPYLNQLFACCIPLGSYSMTQRPYSPAIRSLGGNEYCVDTAIGCINVSNITLFDAFFVRFAIGVGGGIAFLLILFSGFQLMTSAGDPGKVKSAKNLLMSAISGLLLILFSIFILELIGLRILQLPGF